MQQLEGGPFLPDDPAGPPQYRRPEAVDTVIVCAYTCANVTRDIGARTRSAPLAFTPVGVMMGSSSMQQAEGRRYFTEAARQAALVRRREIAALPKDPTGALALFVVRGAESHTDFGWEIRRYGAIVVARSAHGFSGPTAARQAGEEAMRSIGPV